MPVSMTIQNEGSFLRVIYRGEEDLESEQATAAALIEVIQNYDCHKVLHDYRAVTGARMGTLDSYSAAASYDRRFLYVKGALLDHAEHHRENRFWETTVRNQGFPARIFDDEQEAIAWLLDEELSDHACRTTDMKFV